MGIKTCLKYFVVRHQNDSFKNIDTILYKFSNPKFIILRLFL